MNCEGEYYQVENNACGYAQHLLRCFCLREDIITELTHY